jgi:hypothetical protein
MNYDDIFDVPFCTVACKSNSFERRLTGHVNSWWKVFGVFYTEPVLKMLIFILVTLFAFWKIAFDWCVCVCVCVCSVRQRRHVCVRPHKADRHVRRDESDS